MMVQGCLASIFECGLCRLEVLRSCNTTGVVFLLNTDHGSVRDA